MRTDDDLERQMREALGVQPRKEKIKNEASNPMRGYLVVLSVRRQAGPAFRYEFRSRSLSRSEAILEAEKSARADGYRPWALLDVIDA